jgi:hypothetical protein
MKNYKKISASIVFCVALAVIVAAQPPTTAFTYQGKLTDGALPAGGTFEMRFKLFDALAGGTQQPQPTPITLDFTVAGSNPVTVTNGIFTVQLDFGAASFPAAERFLEISVRHNSTEAFTPLAPRQKITSSPFSIKSLSAAAADGLSSACVLCIIDAQISAIDGGKVTGTVANATTAATAGNVTGVVQIANGGTGSSTKNFVDLSTNQTVGGDKTFSNAVSATQYNIGGNRILASPGGDNVFAGRTAGLNTTGGVVNSFFGHRAGEVNTGGSSNSFFGERSGLNSQGVNNSFFGAVAGQTNVNGQNNTILGTLADVGSPGLNFATAIGAGAVVSTSNTLTLGRVADSVQIPGAMSVAGSTTVGADLTVSGTVSGNGSGLTNLNGANITVNSVTSTQLSAETLPNSTAFKLLGSLRWDLLNGEATFPVGSNPAGLAFDGSNIWVANSSSVTKLRASDGANLGTFPAGSSPRAVAFDGANIWAANLNSDNVTKLRASDGANLGTFPAGDGPQAVAFDGANIWVANQLTNDVTKLRASDGENLGAFAVGTSPFGVAFDGANIWVANFSGNVTKLRASDGACVGTCTFPAGSGPRAVAFDGANIWVANEASNNVTKLRASDGANLGTFMVGVAPRGVAFDGANIWVTNQNSNNVTKLRASDGANLGTFPAGSVPRGIAFDGANIWVTNSVSNNVMRLLPAFPQP